MENLLLILDEIDDAVAVLRSLWPQLLGFLLASGLFAATILVAMQWPMATVLLMALTGLGLLLAGLRHISLSDFKTDP
jgi:hypothetical protein